MKQTVLAIFILTMTCATFGSTRAYCDLAGCEEWGRYVQGFDGSPDASRPALNLNFPGTILPARTLSFPRMSETLRKMLGEVASQMDDYQRSYDQQLEHYRGLKERFPEKFGSADGFGPEEDRLIKTIDAGESAALLRGKEVGCTQAYQKVMDNKLREASLALSRAQKWISPQCAGTRDSLTDLNVAIRDILQIGTGDDPATGMEQELRITREALIRARRSMAVKLAGVQCSVPEVSNSEFGAGSSGPRAFSGEQNGSLKTYLSK